LIHTDVVIVGAGPCGLFQVFELGLLGLKAEVVDSIRQPGGQCAELYPDKPIYDIPAIPVCTGEELTEALLKQIKPFDAGMHLGEEVTEVRVLDDEQFHVATHLDKTFRAKAVVIAGGVGANKLLRKEIAERFEGEVYYPRLAFCTDNGAMIAVAGAMRLVEAAEAEQIRAQPRWSLETLGIPGA